MFGVTILGNNSALPAHGRHPTSQIVTLANEDVLMIDCGEGTQMRIRDFRIKTNKLNHIYISHLHGDHYFGVIGIITSMALVGRVQPLHLYAPSPLEDLIYTQLKIADSTLPFDLIFHPLTKEEVITDEKKFTVNSFRVYHRIECYGFVIREKHKARKVIPAKAEAYNIPTDFYKNLQSGEDYISPEGRIINNHIVTSEGKRNKSYAFCADTYYNEAYIPFIKDVDLIYHESTYLNEFTTQARQRFHSTAAQAAEIALKAGAKELLLGHYSSKYKDLCAFETEARAVFPDTYVSEEGVTYLVP